MAEPDTRRLRDLAEQLLRWGHANGGMLSPTFLALRDELPDVAIEFAVRPEKFPEATLQEVVYGLDPAAVAIAVEGTITTKSTSTREKHDALVLSVLAGSGPDDDTAAQTVHAWAVITSALGVPSLGAELPVQQNSSNLMPLAGVPRGNLDEVRDPADQFVQPDGEELGATARKRTSLDVGAINLWAQAREPARRVAVIGTAFQLELLQRNGLLPPTSVIEVAAAD